MARYTAGTAALPGCSNLIEALRAHLAANGWTEHDVINGGAGAQDIVFQGSALDTAADNRPFIRVTWTAATSFAFRCYSDWDTALHSGANVAGATGSSTLTVQNAAFDYVIRANGVSFWIGALIGGVYNKVYQGFVRRGLTSARSGITTTTAPLAIGATSLPVAADMTGKLQVDQYIQVMSYTHTADVIGDDQWTNCELIKITSVAAGAIGCSALTKAYKSGALVGDRVYPIGAGQFTAGPNASGVLYRPFWLDGNSTSATGQPATVAGKTIFDETRNDPGDANQEYGTGVWMAYDTTTDKTGTFGMLYHVISCNVAATLGDLLQDGVTDFLLVGANGQAGTAVKRGD